MVFKIVYWYLSCMILFAAAPVWSANLDQESFRTIDAPSSPVMERADNSGASAALPTSRASHSAEHDDQNLETKSSVERSRSDIDARPGPSPSEEVGGGVSLIEEQAYKKWLFSYKTSPLFEADNNRCAVCIFLIERTQADYVEMARLVLH